MTTQGRAWQSCELKKISDTELIFWPSSLFKSGRPEVFRRKKYLQKFHKTVKKKPVSEFLLQVLGPQQ